MSVYKPGKHSKRLSNSKLDILEDYAWDFFYFVEYESGFDEDIEDINHYLDLAEKELQYIHDTKYRLSSMKWEFIAHYVVYKKSYRVKIHNSISPCFLDTVCKDFIPIDFKTKKEAKLWIDNFTRVNNVTDYSIVE